MTTIISKDTLRASVEAATGGLVTVLYDDAGNPSYMRVFPKVRIEDLYPDLGLTGVHPAFMVDDVEKSELFIGVYPAFMVDNCAVSLPGVDPHQSINFDKSVAACKSKGTGWHLMTNAEWSLVGGLGLKSGFQCRGNSWCGQNYELRHEVGVRWDGGMPGDNTDNKPARTLTGSGPVSWRHDNSPAGVCDLVGNVWEWTGGLRIVNGEYQIIPNNDAAAFGADMSSASKAWKAINTSGALVAPGTAGTFKMDAEGANGTGAVVLNTTITSQYPSTDDKTSSGCHLKEMTAKAGVTVPPLLKLFGLFPYNSAQIGGIWHRNSGERLALRGGDYGNHAYAGLFALNLNDYRTGSYGGVGFRPAFIL